ncbi:MAG: hypothetical protein OEV42_19440 [Deltaproteobacteria bacterium]|nr:hypothetical protein [Deltaproteobacteria bacterium]
MNARHKAWKAMRIIKVFTVADIEATAEIKHWNLSKLLRTLINCGYVVKVNGRKGKKSNRFRLVKDTGPKALEIERSEKALYDHNLEKRVAASEDENGVA